MRVAVDLGWRGRVGGVEQAAELEVAAAGQPVEIDVDAYPDAPLKGRVDSIQRGTGSRFSLLPAENATGNYVKIVQRVPVKIVLDQPPGPGMVLGLGLSVVPTVDVGSKPDAGSESARR